MAVDTFSESVAAEVRAEMARQRLTQRQVAAQLGWDTRMLSRRLNSGVPFSTRDIEQLADALRIPLSALTSPRAASA